MMAAPRVLAGPRLAAGVEPWASHQSRLGAPPLDQDPEALVAAIEASGLVGRGGGGFPVGRKWRRVRGRGGPAVVVANGAEGEPLSAKDRTLMEARPHLIIDGALLAARAVNGAEVVLYVGEEHRHAAAALATAISERRETLSLPVRLVRAPAGYVSGQESAVVHYLNEGVALPTTAPPRPSERGVGLRPTLVHNVETLAHVALIGRYGPRWFRETGRGATPGTALVTAGGPGGGQLVAEVELGATVENALKEAGFPRAQCQALLLGGYFGSWVEWETARRLALDPDALGRAGLSFGCGVLAPLPAGDCGVAATASILAYLASESAGQCGPCLFGLGAIAETSSALASGAGTDGDVRRLSRWAEELPGRGACRHPDGAAGLLRSALRVFAADFARHEAGDTCAFAQRRIA